MGITNQQAGAQFFKGGVIARTQAYATDGAISPSFSHSALITKGSIAADTLAVPGRDGIRLDILSSTNFAHVVTATSLINDGATGVPHTTLTFAAFAGAAVSLLSFGGKWYVTARNGVTVT